MFEQIRKRISGQFTMMKPRVNLVINGHLIGEEREGECQVTKNFSSVKDVSVISEIRAFHYGQGWSSQGGERHL